MSTIAFLYSLLIYQLLQHADALMGGECKLLKDTQTLHPSTVQPGSIISITPNNTDTCGNASYVLLYKNQNSGGLGRLYEQKYYRVETPPIYLNTSGVYCVHKQCETVQKGQCCTKVTVPTKIQILLSESTKLNKVAGNCSVTAWPRPPINNITVRANDGCKTKTLSVRFIDDYTTVAFFVIYMNSTCVCDRVICLASSKQEERAIDISHFTPPTHTSTNTPTLPETTVDDDVPTTNINPMHGGVLGLYRITLWIIVLLLTVLSMTI